MAVKEEVLAANRWIVDQGLVKLTWGNVSALNDDKTALIIKPSGVSLDTAVADDMSLVSLNGELLSGKKPSVDTPTHLELYEYFPTIECVVHTHSKYGTIFAQANRPIPCLGTTHADYFAGHIPCIPHPDAEEIEEGYEMHTGRIIGEYFNENEIDYSHVPGCIVQGHGVFAWGETGNTAIESAYVLELVAEMAFKTLILDSYSHLADFVAEKHFSRKHGQASYYGQ
jgi:L-ribulose-5-phosphate 4-epimerase